MRMQKRIKKLKKSIGKRMKGIKKPLKRKGKKMTLPVVGVDVTAVLIAAIIVVGLVASVALQPEFVFVRPDWAYDTTTTIETTTDTTTTDTTTTTTTTTTEPVVDKYIFKTQWQLTAPETFPAWVLIEFHGNISYKDGVYMFAEGIWYNGVFSYEFEEDEGSMIELRSSTGWLLGGNYAGEMKFVSTGLWSQVFDIYSHVGGSVIGVLFVSWVLL